MGGCFQCRWHSRRGERPARGRRDMSNEAPASVNGVAGVANIRVPHNAGVSRSELSGKASERKAIDAANPSPPSAIHCPALQRTPDYAVL